MCIASKVTTGEIHIGPITVQNTFVIQT